MVRMMKKLLCFLIFIPTVMLAQAKKVISGRVVEAVTQMPVAGASVYVSSSIIANETKIAGVLQGAMIGTTTDTDGKFTLTVEENIKHLLVSYIGFETKVINVSGSNANLKIQLNESAENLQEVVLTGYQKVEKEKRLLLTHRLIWLKFSNQVWQTSIKCLQDKLLVLEFKRLMEHRERLQKYQFVELLRLTVHQILYGF